MLNVFVSQQSYDFMCEEYREITLINLCLAIIRQLHRDNRSNLQSSLKSDISLLQYQPSRWDEKNHVCQEKGSWIFPMTGSSRTNLKAGCPQPWRVLELGLNTADCQSQTELVQDSSVVRGLGLTISELCTLEIVVNITRQLLRPRSHFNTTQILHILSIPCDRALRLSSLVRACKISQNQLEHQYATTKLPWLSTALVQCFKGMGGKEKKKQKQRKKSCKRKK